MSEENAMPTSPEAPTPGVAAPPPPAEDAVTISAAEAEDLRKRAEERDLFLADLKRVQADFLNYQKRVQRDREAMSLMAVERLVRDILAPLDGFHHAVQASSSLPGAERFLEGFTLIEREIFRVLEVHGLKPIEAKGKPFDPNEHEAVGLVETAEAPDQTVLEEFRKGYRLGDRLLRPAQVRVAKTPSAPSPSP